MAGKTFFSVGPSQLFPTVGQHLQTALAENIGSISHRGKQFESIYKETVENLRVLLEIPDGHRIFFFSSANEIWERLLQNCVEHHCFHLVNGSFSAKFHEFAVTLRKNAYKHEVEPGKGFSLNEISVPEEAEAIAAIVNETSSGVQMPLSDVKELAQRYPQKLFFADVVTSLPAVSPDYNFIDCAYFSVQKGFGMPSGLGVAILSPRCVERAKELNSKGQVTGTYHNFSQLEKFAAQNQTPETPNVLFIYLLGKVAGDMLKYGIENIRIETAQKAKMIYQAIEKSSELDFFVKEPAHRSITTIVAEVKGGSTSLIERLKSKGLILASGYGAFKEKQIRIANFPSQSSEMTEQLLKELPS